MTERVEPTGLIEQTGKWLLPVGDGVVTQLRIDFAFTLIVESWIEIRIETEFSYGAPGAESRFDPSTSTGLVPLLDRHQAQITAAEICKDGRLTLTFADDAVLVVEPDDQYEAFTVTSMPPPGFRGFRFVAVPGRGLAHWVAEHRQ
ncbi:DUF6188 family protein [Micromonospora ureilytica]|uniref:DUF6188 family protein n=1 Tax=Micromonospora TaxID=1873 RepID=UPI002E11BE5D|nr:DUF6188 family protein [Micromonospora ureilytica]